jgi:hypothetical protein
VKRRDRGIRYKKGAREGVCCRGASERDKGEKIAIEEGRKFKVRGL